VAARGGDDVWVEIRRRRILDDDRIPDDLFGAPPPTAAASVAPSAPPIDDSIPDFDDAPAPAPIAARTPDMPLAAVPEMLEADDDLSLSLPDSGQLFGGPSAAPPAPKPVPAVSKLAPPPPAPPKPAPLKPAPVAAAPVAVAPPPAPKPVAPPPKPVAPPAPPVMAAAPVAPPPAAVAAPPATVAPPPAAPPAPAPDLVPLPIAPAAFTPPPAAAAPIQPPPIVAPPAITLQPEPIYRAPAPPFAPVLPLTRSPIRMDTPAPIVSSGLSDLDRLLRMAAARGASTLYLSSHARPSVRVDGEIQMLEGEPSHGPNDVESLLLTMMPERTHEALRTGQATEWVTDLDGVGRVRCLSFRDHRGPGGVFRMMPVRAVSTEQLGLTREVQSLAIEPEGIVLIAGPRLSGKRTMISAFVDLMNRTRRDHVITIENEINVVHERGTSFISQREVRGSHEEVEAVARAALREDPDVLVIE